jgi:hypothetical protein
MKMKNVKDFIKLFDLNVPNVEHFDYYIAQLQKTPKFSNIYDLIKMFEEADISIDDFYEYKLSKSKEIIDFIKTTNAYTDLCYDNNLADLPTNKSFSYEEGIKYLSIDLRSANWVSLKKYDQENQLGNSYDEFLKRFDLPEIFTHSKYLRQFIFGNVNPKKQQKVQRNTIQEIVRQFSNDLTVECVKNDEVIFSFKEYSEIKELVQTLDLNKYKSKIFSVQRVEDFRIDTHYDLLGNNLTKEMVGVNGQQFYLKLKQYITGDPLDIRDLYFKQDGKLAIWMVEGLEVKV